MSSEQALPSVTRLFPKRFMRWQQAGLSVRAAAVLSNAGCDTPEQVTQLGRSYFEGRPNCGERTLAELAERAGWPPKRPTAVDAIAAALGLAISDPEETREMAADTIIALRRSGFVIVAGQRRGRLA